MALFFAREHNYFRAPQHFLNFLPLPHGQGSLRPMRGVVTRTVESDGLNNAAAGEYGDSAIRSANGGGPVSLGSDRSSEKLAQSSQQAALAFVVKSLVENLLQVGRADCQANRAVGVARQIGR